MSTRGFVGFVVDGEEKIAYNHSDSYPDWLGERMLTWLHTEIEAASEGLMEAKAATLPDDAVTNQTLAPFEAAADREAPAVAVAKLAALVRALRVVDEDSEPTDDDIERLKEFYNGSVDGGPRNRPSWYQLLRHTQGNPAAMLQAGVIEDASGFPADSLFAEWGYVVDLDNESFEVYRGFQRAPHDKGRFATARDHSNGYYPVALVGIWPLSALPTDKEFAEWASVVNS